MNRRGALAFGAYVLVVGPLTVVFLPSWAFWGTGLAALTAGMVWRREPVRRIVSHGGVFAAFAVAMQLWVMPLLS